MLNFINESEKRNHSPESAKTKLREIQLARMRQMGVAEINVPVPSKTSINRIWQELDCHVNNAEVSTSARDEACAFKLNQVVFAGMQEAVSVDNIFPNLIGNVDATQFTLKMGKKGCKVIWNKKPKQFKSITSQKGSGDLSTFFVKYYLCIFAGGTVGPAVYIVADPNMDNEAVDVHSVPGLGIGTDINNVGYVVFVKERGYLPKRFYEWWFKECLILTISAIRKHHGLPDDATSWFQLDGESCQLQIFKDMDMQELLKAAFIVVGKPSGSTTEITQAADKGSIFRYAKQLMELLNLDVITLMEEHLKQVLLSVWEAHNINIYGQGNTQKKKWISKRHEKLGVFGVMKVQKALQHSATPGRVSDSFQAIGVYPYDLNVILQNCTSKFTTEEYEEVKRVMPEIVQCFKQEGEITDEQLEQLSTLPMFKIDKKKDALIVSRRRCCILTNKNFFTREAQKSNDKQQQAIDKELLARQKEYVAFARQEEAAAKKAAVQARREAAKEKRIADAQQRLNRNVPINPI